MTTLKVHGPWLACTFFMIALRARISVKNVPAVGRVEADDLLHLPPHVLQRIQIYVSLVRRRYLCIQTDIVRGSWATGHQTATTGKTMVAQSLRRPRSSRRGMPAIVRAQVLLIVVAAALIQSVVGSSTSASSSSFRPFDPANQRPISFKSGPLKAIRSKWGNARDLALLEQAVEDHNAEFVATAPNAAIALTYRRVIVLPLDDRFDPPAGVFSHGHVQTGDKMSLPSCFWQSIMKTKAEVPWLFEVSRVDGVTGERAVMPIGQEDAGLDRVVGGAIDFRSPSNYVFLPRWMMLALALKPRDVVDVRLKQDTPPGSAVRLRPHSSAFLKITNHQAVLETELKHYSSLVRGSTIPFDYLGKRYYFDVIDLRSAPRGEKVPMAKVQDCDIAAEFTKAKDQIKPKDKKK